MDFSLGNLLPIDDFSRDVNDNTANNPGDLIDTSSVWNTTFNHAARMGDSLEGTLLFDINSAIDRSFSPSNTGQKAASTTVAPSSLSVWLQHNRVYVLATFLVLGLIGFAFTRR